MKYTSTLGFVTMLQFCTFDRKDRLRNYENYKSYKRLN